MILMFLIYLTKENKITSLFDLNNFHSQILDVIFLLEVPLIDFPD